MGHIERIVESKMTKLIIVVTVVEKWRRGRSKKRWGTEVEKDINPLKIIRWKEIAKDRSRWRKITNEAMAGTTAKFFLAVLLILYNKKTFAP